MARRLIIRSSWPGPLAVFLGGLVLYGATLAPTVLWGDDAELQRIVVTGEARAIGQSSRASHLLWLAIAAGLVRHTSWLPLDAAGRTNLVTALFGALTLPFIYLAAARLAGPVARYPAIAGLAAATAFGLSHTFWLLAVRPDVYTLSMALLAMSAWGILCWRSGGGPAPLALAASGVALALTNHVLILASVPGLAVLAITVPTPRRQQLLRAAGVAAVPVALVILAAMQRGVPLDDLLRAVLSYRPQVPPVRDVLLVPAYLLYQFPVSIPLAVWGASRLWRRDRGALAGLAALYAGNVLLMLVRHHPAMYVRDQYIFFLPSYVPVALAIGVGCAAALEAILARGWSCRARRLAAGGLAGALLATLVVYPLAAWLGGATAQQLAPARQLPGRDPVAFYLLPSKASYWGARAYGESALAALPPNAAVVADWLPYQTLRYLQVVEGRRPDVLLAQLNAGEGRQLAFLLEHEGQRPLFLADASPYPYYELAEIERCFAVMAHGVVYRLVPRTAAGGCRDASGTRG